jgi:hypothetical protein
MSRVMKRFLGSAALVAILGVPAGANAASVHAAAKPDTMTIRGVVSAIDGKWTLTVHDDRNFIENIALHPGTVIEPTGLRLEPGMRVSVLGYQDNANFDADKILGPVNAQPTPHADGAPSATLMPEEIPNGTFQTQGPTAEGGG